MLDTTQTKKLVASKITFSKVFINKCFKNYKSVVDKRNLCFVVSEPSLSSLELEQLASTVGCKRAKYTTIDLARNDQIHYLRLSNVQYNK
jgi:predicted nucleic acid-binding protein